MDNIKGTINYTMTYKDGTWHLVYDQTTENDLAAMAIGASLMEYTETTFEDAVKDPEVPAKAKKPFKARLTKVRAAKFGLNLMIEYLSSVLEEYKKFLEDNKKQEAPKLTDEEAVELKKMMKDFNIPQKDEVNKGE